MAAHPQCPGRSAARSVGRATARRIGHPVARRIGHPVVCLLGGSAVRLLGVSAAWALGVLASRLFDGSACRPSGRLGCRPPARLAGRLSAAWLLRHSAVGPSGGWSVGRSAIDCSAGRRPGVQDAGEGAERCVVWLLDLVSRGVDEAVWVCRIAALSCGHLGVRHADGGCWVCHVGGSAAVVGGAGRWAAAATRRRTVGAPSHPGFLVDHELSLAWSGRFGLA
jgi:hypothetical protein